MLCDSICPSIPQASLAKPSARPRAKTSTKCGCQFKFTFALDPRSPLTEEEANEDGRAEAMAATVGGSAYLIGYTGLHCGGCRPSPAQAEVQIRRAGLPLSDDQLSEAYTAANALKPELRARALEQIGIPADYRLANLRQRFESREV